MKNLQLQSQDGRVLGTYPILTPYNFYVNGVLTTPTNGIVALQSQRSYELRGTLVGKITIGEENEQPTDDTFIYLNGVTIITDDESNCGISYLPSAQSLYVTLARNTKNIIKCEHVAEMAEQQGAALYSENNMVVQGAGYLSVLNLGGHGIKASELRFSGNPHIFADAIHDGIHGNSNLTIDNGVFYVINANDAFGTGSSGEIHVFAGKFNAYNIRQYLFDAKVKMYVWAIGGIESLTINTDLTYVSAEDNRWFNNYETSLNEYFPDPQVLDGAEEAVIGEDGCYHITGTGAHITGLIVNPIIFEAQSTDVVLDRAMIVTTEEADSILYSPTSKKLKIQCSPDTVNFIVCQSPMSNAAIKSNGNLAIEVKSGAHLVLNSQEGNAIDCSDFYFHDSKGCLLVSDCEYGIRGTDIYFADSPDHKAFEDEAVYGTLCIHDCTKSDIFARKSSKGKKANITLNPDNLRGIICVGKIEVEPGSTETTGADLGSSTQIVFNAITADVKKNIPPKTSQPYAVIPLDDHSIPII